MLALRAAVCLLAAGCACTAGRKRKRLSAQDVNSKIIQNIQDKLVDDNEDYLPEESPEAEINLVIGKTKVQLNGTIAQPDLAQFNFKIGNPVIEEEPPSESEQEKTRTEPKLPLRTREEMKIKHNTKTTETVSSTAGEVWDPYMTELEETKRVKFQPREDVPDKSEYSAATARSAPWTHQVQDLLNADARASSIVVYNFYPITQPKKRADVKVRIGRTDRSVRSTLHDLRKAMSLDHMPMDSTERPEEELSVHAEEESGFVTFRYRAKIPVEVPLARRWIANAFS